MKLITRSAVMTAAGTGLKIIAADELPVQRFDKYTQETYSEILLMSGIEWRGGKRQLVMVDCGNRSSIDHVLGSVRRLRVENGQLIGDAYFADDRRSQEIKRKVMDGHVDQFEVTAAPVESKRIQAGRAATVHGRKIAGPAVVVTRWKPIDISLWV